MDKNLFAPIFLPIFLDPTLLGLKFFGNGLFWIKNLLDRIFFDKNNTNNNNNHNHNFDGFCFLNFSSGDHPKDIFDTDFICSKYYTEKFSS